MKQNLKHFSINSDGRLELNYLMHHGLGRSSRYRLVPYVTMLQIFKKLQTFPKLQCAQAHKTNDCFMVKTHSKHILTLHKLSGACRRGRLRFGNRFPVKANDFNIKFQIVLMWEVKTAVMFLKYVRNYDHL